MKRCGSSLDLGKNRSKRILTNKMSDSIQIVNSSKRKMKNKQKNILRVLSHFYLFLSGIGYSSEHVSFRLFHLLYLYPVTGAKNTLIVSPCREVRPFYPKECPVYDTKLHLMVWFQFWNSGRVHF